jgi:hypothetical protein
MKTQNFTIDDKRMDRLREHCEKTGLKMSTVVRMGLDLYFIREHKKEKKDAVV